MRACCSPEAFPGHLDSTTPPIRPPSSVYSSYFPKPFRITSFADPHSLTPIESHLYEKPGGGGGHCFPSFTFSSLISPLVYPDLASGHSTCHFCFALRRSAIISPTRLASRDTGHEFHFLLAPRRCTYIFSFHTPAHSFALRKMLSPAFSVACALFKKTEFPQPLSDQYDAHSLQKTPGVRLPRLAFRSPPVNPATARSLLPHAKQILCRLTAISC